MGGWGSERDLAEVEECIDCSRRLALETTLDLILTTHVHGPTAIFRWRLSPRALAPTSNSISRFRWS